MDKPFAITLDVGSSLANKTGSLAHRARRSTSTACRRATTPARPARTSRRWLYEAEEGGDGYERAWRKIMEDNPFPAIMGRVCYHPCETACNRGQLDEAVGINSVERFLGDEAIKQGWQRRGRRRADAASGCWSSAPGPSGLSAAYHLRRLGHAVTIHEAGPMAGGMMRFGIPKYRLPRDVLDAEVAADPRPGRRARARTARSRTSLEAMREGGFDAAFLAVGAHIGKRAYIPAGEAARILDAVSLLRSMEGEEQPLLGRRVVVYGGGNTAMDAARTAKRLGADRGDRRLPAHPRADARARLRGRGGRGGGRDDEVALHDQAGRRRQARAREDGARRDRLPAADRRARGARGRLAGARARPGGRPLAARRRRRASRSRTASSQVGPNMMTGHPGIFAGGDMVPAERTVTVGVGHGKKAARHIDAWLRGASYRAARRSTSSPTFDTLNTWYYADAPRTVQPQLEIARRQLDLRRGGRRARRVERALRGAPLPVVRQLLLAATTATASAPTTPCSSSAAPGEHVRDRPRLLQGLRPLRRGVPCGAIEMVPEEI